MGDRRFPDREAAVNLDKAGHGSDQDNRAIDQAMLGHPSALKPLTAVLAVGYVSVLGDTHLVALILVMGAHLSGGRAGFAAVRVVDHLRSPPLIPEARASVPADSHQSSRAISGCQALKCTGPKKKGRLRERAAQV